MDSRQSFEIVDPCSPEGIEVLASDAFRLAVEQAVQAAEERKRAQSTEHGPEDAPQS